MSWRRAYSLQTLLNQINDAYPNRSKASDGAIGDTAHASRPSDHNPDKNGVVKAQDITHDPANGVNGNILAPLLAKDSRVAYTIFNRKLYSAGKAVDYTGSNPHDKHFHVSVKDAVKDQSHGWNIGKEEAVSYIDPKDVESIFATFEVPFDTNIGKENQKQYYSKHPGGYARLYEDLLKVKYAHWKAAQQSVDFVPVTDQLFKKK